MAKGLPEPLSQLSWEPATLSGLMLNAIEAVSDSGHDANILYACRFVTCDVIGALQDAGGAMEEQALFKSAYVQTELAEPLSHVEHGSQRSAMDAGVLEMCREVIEEKASALRTIYEKAHGTGTGRENTCGVGECGPGEPPVQGISMGDIDALVCRLASGWRVPPSRRRPHRRPCMR